MLGAALSVLTALALISGLAAGAVAAMLGGRSAISPVTAFGWGCVLGPVGWIVVAAFAHRTRSVVDPPGSSW